MMKKATGLAAISALSVAGLVSAQSARDHINIVGSSTVYPFSTVVAEQFGKTTRFKTPVVESTGSGGGLKLFCAGVGVEYPDITNSSRRIKESEVKMCAGNNVKEIVEVKIGYDGIVVANSVAQTQLSFTSKQIFQALAKEVPDPAGDEKLVANPYKKWSDIDKALPASKIEVLGPPPTSGTRDAFVELAMEGGCKQFPWIKAMEDTDKNAYKTLCHTIREDGAYVEAGENDNLIVQKLEANPNALGVFGFSFMDQNIDKVQGSLVDGQEPTFEAIASGDYPVSRPLYFYVKKAHVGVIPGIEELVAEFTSDRAWGDEGYLSDKGLIPLPAGEREQMQSDARGLALLQLASN